MESGLAPDLKLGFEAVPVDQLATAIVSMTLKEEEEEENEDMKNRVRHHGMMLNLTNPNELSLKDYVQILSELKNKSNPKNKTPIEIIPFAEWKRRVIDQIPESSPLYSLTLYFQKEEEHDSSLDQPLPLEEELTHFETNLAQSELAKHGIVYPCDYKKLLETVVY
jgi:thioester reductase-like protein